MNKITEIEEAIEKLPAAQVDELAGWLELFRLRKATSSTVESWLENARGVVRTGDTTESIMALTRGED